MGEVAIVVEELMTLAHGILPLDARGFNDATMITLEPSTREAADALLARAINLGAFAPDQWLETRLAVLAQDNRASGDEATHGLLRVFLVEWLPQRRPGSGGVIYAAEPAGVPLLAGYVAQSLRTIVRIIDERNSMFKQGAWYTDVDTGKPFVLGGTLRQWAQRGQIAAKKLPSGANGYLVHSVAAWLKHDHHRLRQLEARAKRDGIQIIVTSALQTR